MIKKLLFTVKVLHTLSLIFICFEANATIRYVKQFTNGSGISWADANGDLQDMINQSSVGDSIFVAKGIYQPIRTITSPLVIDSNNVNNAFLLKNGVVILGGFDSIGAPQLLDRDWVFHKSVLSGDIGQPQITTDNCLHVVVAGPGTKQNATLDGFTISGGRANGSYPSPLLDNTIVYSSNGAGLISFKSKLNLQNLIIEHNYSPYNGGGVYFYGDSSSLRNLTIRNNVALNNGGGLYSYASVNNLKHCTINTNHAREGGGGGYSSSRLTITNTRIIGNSSDKSGGGWINQQSRDSLYNVLIAGNTSVFGAAGYANYFGFATIVNTTVANNHASSNTSTGGGITAGGTTDIFNSIVWGNSAKASDSGLSVSVLAFTNIKNNIIQGNVWLNNNSNNDPIFENAPNLTIADTLGDYRLKSCSPARDRGWDSVLFAGLNTDLEGLPRIQNGRVDLGAYEFNVVLLGDYTLCRGDSIIINNKVYKENYSGPVDTFTDVLGCDSFVSINITVLTLDTTVSLMGSTLSIADTNAQYQWYDCASGMAISGANDAVYTATTSGSYKAIISRDGCIDSTQCYPVNVTTHIGANQNNISLVIYPNPTKDELYIDVSVPISHIEVFDLTGRKVQSVIPISTSPIRLSIESIPTGLYFLHIHVLNGAAYVSKILKE